MNRCLAVVGALAFGVHAYAQDVPVFQVRMDLVPVSVAVKKGNNAVVGLTAADFVLTDNGVRHQVQAVSLDGVPLDVTLFMDTSGSTSATLDDMRESVEQIAAMLRPEDRFRLLTIGSSVYEAIPWSFARAVRGLPVSPFRGVSLVFDGVAAAVLHRVEPGRRHLVVALTDGADCGSAVRPSQLKELAGRSDAVVHWLVMVGSDNGNSGGRGWCTALPARGLEPDTLKDVVVRTGGAEHLFIWSVNPVKAFSRVLEEFRQSYVLYFTPTGVVVPGWHRLTVDVPGGKYTIHARAGYFPQ